MRSISRSSDLLGSSAKVRRLCEAEAAATRRASLGELKRELLSRQEIALAKVAAGS